MDSWKWVLKRYWVLICFSLLTCIAGILYEPARWNMITTVWGTFLGGVVVWIWLEVSGPSLQRTAWLRKNRNIVEALLNSLVIHAAFTVKALTDCEVSLAHGLSLQDRLAEINEIERSLPADAAHSRPEWVAAAFARSSRRRDSSMPTQT